MLSIITSLYNNGNNNGDITIESKTASIKCHSFVLNLTSEFVKQCIAEPTFNGSIDLDFTEDVINISMQYLYCEQIVDKNLTSFDIIELVNLLDVLKCTFDTSDITEFYTVKFSHTLNTENWGSLLNATYRNPVYLGLQKCIIDFYENTILENVADNQSELNRNFSLVHENIKQMLFSICIDKLSHTGFDKQLRDATLKRKQKMNAMLKEQSDSDDDADEVAKTPVKTCKKITK